MPKFLWLPAVGVEMLKGCAAIRCRVARSIGEGLQTGTQVVRSHP
jgi:hypothetical protein